MSEIETICNALKVINNSQAGFNEETEQRNLLNQVQSDINSFTYFLQILFEKNGMLEQKISESICSIILSMIKERFEEMPDELKKYIQDQFSNQDRIKILSSCLGKSLIDISNAILWFAFNSYPEWKDGITFYLNLPDNELKLQIYFHLLEILVHPLPYYQPKAQQLLQELFQGPMEMIQNLFFQQLSNDSPTPVVYKGLGCLCYIVSPENIFPQAQKILSTFGKPNSYSSIYFFNSFFSRFIEPEQFQNIYSSFPMQLIFSAIENQNALNDLSNFIGTIGSLMNTFDFSMDQKGEIAQYASQIILKGNPSTISPLASFIISLSPSQSLNILAQGLQAFFTNLQSYDIFPVKPFINSIQTAFSLDFNSCLEFLNSLADGISSDTSYLLQCIISVIIESALLEDPKKVTSIGNFVNLLLPFWTFNINCRTYQFLYHFSRAIFLNKLEPQAEILQATTDKLFELITQSDLRFNYKKPFINIFAEYFKNNQSPIFRLQIPHIQALISTNDQDAIFTAGMCSDKEYVEQIVSQNPQYFMLKFAAGLDKSYKLGEFLSGILPNPSEIDDGSLKFGIMIIFKNGIFQALDAYVSSINQIGSLAELAFQLAQEEIDSKAQLRTTYLQKIVEGTQALHSSITCENAVKIFKYFNKLNLGQIGEPIFLIYQIINEFIAKFSYNASIVEEATIFASLFMEVPNAPINQFAPTLLNFIVYPNFDPFVSNDKKKVLAISKFHSKVLSKSSDNSIVSFERFRSNMFLEQYVQILTQNPNIDNPEAIFRIQNIYQKIHVIQKGLN